jgi:hypothetical protein
MIQELQSAHNNSLSNINLIDCELDALTLTQRYTVLQLIEQKLEHNGKVSITGIDALEISRGFYKGYLNLEKYNALLRPSLCTLEDIQNKLEELGLQIIVKRINDYKYYIEAIRQ